MQIPEFLKDVTRNSFKGFCPNDEGYSVKKMMFAFVVVNMMILTYRTTTADMLVVVLGTWLAFATSLIVTGAVEKNIKEVNKTKQVISNNAPNGDSTTASN